MQPSTVAPGINPDVCSSSLPDHSPDAEFVWTSWPSRFADQLGTVRYSTWGVFCDKLSACSVAPLKDNMPGWSPATFVNRRRGMKNVQAVWAVVLDYDAKTVETKFEDAARLFAHSAALLITTHSHGDVHRFRVVLPTCRPVTAQEYSLLWDHMIALVGLEGHKPGVVEKDASRFWFLPGHPRGQDGYVHRVCYGPPIDVDPIVEARSKAKDARISEFERRRREAIEAREALQRERDAKRGCRPQMSVIERASMLLADIEGGISGAGGSAHCFDAAQVLVRGFNLSDEEALSLLESEYNPRCSPAWSRRELMHKIKSAREKSSKTFGFLLGDRETWLIRHRANEAVTVTPPPLWSPEEVACTDAVDVPTVDAGWTGGQGRG